MPCGFGEEGVGWRWTGEGLGKRGRKKPSVGGWTRQPECTLSIIWGGQEWPKSSEGPLDLHGPPLSFYIREKRAGRVGA